MSLGLGDRQRAFAVAAAQLIIKANELGYGVTLGDAYRDPRAFGVSGEAGPYGSKTSNHKKRLAIDLNLFTDGEYITDDRGHRELGAWWELSFEEFGARWGGRYMDPNHYEFIHA